MDYKFTIVLYFLKNFIGNLNFKIFSLPFFEYFLYSLTPYEEVRWSIVINLIYNIFNSNMIQVIFIIYNFF